MGFHREIILQTIIESYNAVCRAGVVNDDASLDKLVDEYISVALK